MNVEFTKNTWGEFEYWIGTDSEIVLKIKELLKDIKRSSFKG